MTVLSACQEAAKLLRPAQPQPTAIFGSTDTFAKELAALSNEAARAIAKAYDWQTLLVLETHSGDGSTTAFDLAADYDRMPKEMNVWSSGFGLPMERVDSLDEWLDRILRSFVGSVGYWMIIGGQLNIMPAMAATDSAKYYYISKYIATDESATNIEKFTADTDTFRLSERLLTLELIWRWRHRKGFDYAEDMRNAQIAFSEDVMRDKGARIIKVGRTRIPDDVVSAYPGTISAS